MARREANLADKRRRYAANPRDGILRGQVYFAEQGLRTAQTQLGLSRLRDGSASFLQDSTPARDTTLDPPRAANSSRADNSAAREAARKAEAQREFVIGLQAENDARKFQLTLIGQQERAAKVAEAIRTAELQAQAVGLDLTQTQREAIAQTVGDLHDAEMVDRARVAIAQTARDLAQARGQVETEAAYVQRRLAEEQLTLETAIGLERAQQLQQLYQAEDAARRRQAAEKTLSDLGGLRSDIQDRIEFLQSVGQNAEVARLTESLARVDDAMVAAIDHAVQMWTAIGGPEAESAILRLLTTRDTIADVGGRAFITGEQINQMIIGGGVQAFDRFAQSLADGAGAFESLRDSFLQFAADFLRQIAMMIAQQEILNALGIGDPVKGKGGGKGGVIANFITGLFRHGGGLIGTGGGGRTIPLAAMAGATRYHTGGIIGLKPNEVPVVALRGEEMLTESDPRHRKNLGRGQGGGTKIINIFDPAELLDRALATEAGERVLLNYVSRNSGAFKAAIG
ncbi:MAG: hypothetical protein KF910_03680 [Brevundimonas sp.]|uniref:hypothetical protein n=1 Tax=Brevundimonas sp. TaxID=1871086 RepID=UPI0025C729AD|nr:hypothetical protein [Brevundimonas sp.]MBX3476680.1 hypothetical protein [Brevundimonas sp.]